MEIKTEQKFKSFFKRYGVLSLACVIALVVALSIGLNIPKDDSVEDQPVSTIDMSFALPMNNAAIVKDFADDRLQFNEALNRWEIHLSVDFSSEDLSVFSVLDGVVAEVDSNSLAGTYVKIEHADGFVSVYSSLDDTLNVSEGDKVAKGQLIGLASASATNEIVEGGHLHFTLLKDGQEVDPNSYLDLQNK